jgi:phenylacetate-coenzyme A ligase PaaK-like adenylate-forming protein
MNSDAMQDRTSAIKAVSDFTAIRNESDFMAKCLDAFHYQAVHVPVYREFLRLMDIRREDVSSMEEIPFLPADMFRNHDVISDEKNAETVFTSSGTTGSEQSRHPVADLSMYEKSFEASFRLFYGNPEEYCILALLPSYLERDGSSLIYMTEKLIWLSRDPLSGFFLNNHDALSETIQKLNRSGRKTILLGVSYALLDFSEKHPIQLHDDFIVMETGGMKGRRKEMIRVELHEKLTSAFGVETIHSEYGMTELLSQAYSNGQGIFRCPPWMKILCRDIYDPLSHPPANRSGAVNIVDLANYYSCSFIATSDIGKIHDDGSFEILGRIDNSIMRGCNLLIH